MFAYFFAEIKAWRSIRAYSRRYSGCPRPMMRIRLNSISTIPTSSSQSQISHRKKSIPFTNKVSAQQPNFKTSGPLSKSSKNDLNIPNNLSKSKYVSCLVARDIIIRPPSAEILDRSEYIGPLVVVLGLSTVGA